MPPLLHAAAFTCRLCNNIGAERTTSILLTSESIENPRHTFSDQSVERIF
jgi:hypothetical protein